MEIKSCEEYVLARLEELEEENAELRRFIVDLTELLISKGVVTALDVDDKLVS